MDINDLRSMPPAELAYWIRKNPQKARQIRKDFYWMRVKLARKDPNEFCELVLRDEETGRPIVQNRIHERFQHLAQVERRLLLWGHIESGKTQQLSIGHTLWELGHDPRLRCVVGSATVRYGVRIIGAIRRIIERPGPIHDIFPDLRPGPVWQASAITVDIPNTKGIPKDPTLQITSVGTSSLTGSRTDRFIGDDLLNLDNTSTPGKRQATKDWYYAIPMSRMTKNSKVRIVGNAFHPEDLMHDLAGHGGYAWRKFPVLDAEGQSTWPERWSLDRIEAQRLENHPHEFARLMLCIPRDESQSRFKREWIDQCLARGDGFVPAFALSAIPPGFATYTGVDLGVRTKRGSDQTVLTTILVHPNGDRELLWIESGRWAGRDIVDRIIDTHKRYNSIVIVENNAAQQYIVDFTKDASAVPVRPFHTGANKANPAFGVESIATEMANGKWILPSRNGKPANKEIDQLVTGMLYYDPQEHTSDHLMSLWFAREGSRQPPKKRATTKRIDTLSR